MITRTCAHCGKPFTPNVASRKYCNHDCYYKASKSRKAKDYHHRETHPVQPRAVARRTCSTCGKHHQVGEKWYSNSSCSLECYERRPRAGRASRINVEYQSQHVKRALSRFREATGVTWPYQLGECGLSVYNELLFEAIREAEATGSLALRRRS